MQRRVAVKRTVHPSLSHTSGLHHLHSLRKFYIHVHAHAHAAECISWDACMLSCVHEVHAWKQ
jgi:hypothetical protein